MGGIQIGGIPILATIYGGWDRHWGKKSGEQQYAHIIDQCNICVVVCLDIGGWDKTNGEQSDGSTNTTHNFD